MAYLLTCLFCNNFWYYTKFWGSVEFSSWLFPSLCFSSGIFLLPFFKSTLFTVYISLLRFPIFSVSVFLCLPLLFSVLPIPLPLSLSISYIFSHHRKAFIPGGCRLLCITFFWFRYQRRKDTLPSSSNYKNPERGLSILAYIARKGTVSHCNLWVKLEENSNSLKEGRSSSGQTKQ